LFLVGNDEVGLKPFVLLSLKKITRLLTLRTQKITPLQSDCQTKFTYIADGYIGFANEASQETIKHLKLDIDKL